MIDYQPVITDFYNTHTHTMLTFVDHHSYTTAAIFISMFWWSFAFIPTSTKLLIISILINLLIISIIKHPVAYRISLSPNLLPQTVSSEIFNLQERKAGKSELDERINNPL